MNRKTVSKFFIITGGIFASLYILFLLLPFMLIPVFDTLSSKLTTEIKNITGFKAEFNKFRIITTPKLSAGAGLSNIKIYQPDGELIMSGDNFKVKLSLLPLLMKKIELDSISADKIDVKLIVKDDGHFLLEDFFLKETDEANAQPKKEEAATLPFDFKLSNKLPDFKLKEHNISFVEQKNGKEYKLTGANTAVTDFVFNKSIKLQTVGKLVLDDFEAFNYDIKILNRIMPDVDINNMLNMAETKEETPVESNNEINVIDIFKAIKDNRLTANLVSDIKVNGTFNAPELTGDIILNQLSMLVYGAKLPDSNLDINFYKDSYKIASNFYTAPNESISVTGLIKTGRNPNMNLNCKSNANLKGIFETVNTIAMILGINDFKTLKAQGILDMDFNFKSDFNSLASSGYLRLLNGSVDYGLYDVKINNITSDIKLDNDAIVIDKLGFSTLSVPLNITGKIASDTTCGIKIQTDKLPIKGLLVSLGQAAILKENPVNSGTITMQAAISDKLSAPKIQGNLFIHNLNMKNIPSDVTLSVNPVEVKVKTTKTGFEGTIEANNIKAVNPAVTVSALALKGVLNENEIKLQNSTVFAGKNEAAVSGVISNYLTDKINLKFQTDGKISSILSGTINPYKMTMDLKYIIPTSAEIIIPGFDKSNLRVNGSTAITGSMMNPVLKGQFNVPHIQIPEVPVVMKNMNINLNGPVLLGNAIVGDFTSGGIIAKNIKTDFRMSGNDFYLNNMAGSAFDGSFLGDIVYNMASEECKVKFKGENMNALKAIEGAAGIKNALTGSLAFDADVNFKGVEYNAMMKSLNGNADFEINKGVLANLGGLNTLLKAQNIVSNSILKTSTEKISALPVVQAASEFDYIKGQLSFKNAYANLLSVKMSGPSMAYYITGKFHLLNGTTNAVILGRLSQNTVAVLGNIGDLAVGKLTSLIPGLGSLTSSIAKSMNESPKNVAVNEIPVLRSSDTKYKDFKAVFNGGIESSSSVKSFKWLNEIDVTGLNSNPSDAKVQEAKTSVENAIKEAKSAINQVKEQAGGQTGGQIKEQAKEQAKELINSLLAPQTQKQTENAE